MATSPETFSKIKNLLRKMDQSIDSARSKRLTSNTPAPSAAPQPLPPPTHSLQAAAANNVPIRPRAIARPQIQQRPAV
jgi:hypothetical protein